MSDQTLNQKSTEQDRSNNAHKGAEHTPDKPHDELFKCQQDLADYKDKYMRLSADYQNMMRRIEKERSSFKKMMLSDVLLNLLEIFDNVERIKHDMVSGHGNAASWQQAIELIYKDFLKLFNKYGVKEITEYKTFNPEFHEAVMHVDAPEQQSGDVVQVLQKGYLLDNNILRIARVSIAK